MAAGVPTICTDRCGIASHLSAQESMIVPAGDVHALKNAIESVQNEEKWQALAINGPRIARERFSLEKMIEAYEALL